MNFYSVFCNLYSVLYTVFLGPSSDSHTADFSEYLLNTSSPKNILQTTSDVKSKLLNNEHENILIYPHPVPSTVPPFSSSPLYLATLINFKSPHVPCSFMWVWQSFSHVQLSVTPGAVACQAPLSMEFSRQEYWSGLPFPSPGDLPNPWMEPGLLHCRQIVYHPSHQSSPGFLLFNHTQILKLNF